MTELRHLALALLLAAGPARPAAADGLALGYLEGAAVRAGERPADGGPVEEGAAVNLRIPLGDRWFVTGSVQRLDAYVDSFGGAHAEEERASFGIGARRGSRDNEMFARLVYTDIREWRYFNQDGGGGTTLSVGGRSLFTPWLEGTVEGGLGVFNGSRDENKGVLLFNGQLALRLVPHVWAYAAYVVDDEARMQLGLRLSFSHARSPTRRAAVRSAGPGSGPMLVAGNTLVTTRPLQLQARPAYGAPETVKAPAGETLTLVETRRNEFGNWWRVSFSGQEGWVREGWLLPVE
jgi:hypothetical protein